MKRHTSAVFIFLIFSLLSGRPTEPNPGGILVEDMFGQVLGPKAPLQLVDWQGYLANPAIEFDILVPKRLALPAMVSFQSKEPRLHFNLPSTAGPDGPFKEIEIQESGRVGVLVSIYPDRDGKKDTCTISVALTDAKGKQWNLDIPVEVLDQDVAQKPSYPITVDFSQDQTGFFADVLKQEVVRQAANDWAAFFDGSGLSPVAPEAEETFIWKKEGFTGGHTVRNAKEYVGFLLYAYGIQTAELRAGGEGSSSGGFQMQEEVEVPLRRSGGVEMDTRGNFNQLGWLVSLKDAEWWKATNLGDVAHDLYSIAHHEIGHSMIFDRAYPLQAKAKEAGNMETPALLLYLGRAPKIDTHDHLHGTVDPITRHGAYGFEYHGEMPLGRWLATPTDLLFAEAIGYRLLPIAATMPLSVSTTSLPTVKAGKTYRVLLQAQGGVPIYRWELGKDSPKLPAGLKLNPITGEIHGRPRRPGMYELHIRVRDAQRASQGVERVIQLRVLPR